MVPYIYRYRNGNGDGYGWGRGWQEIYGLGGGRGSVGLSEGIGGGEELLILVDDRNWPICTFQRGFWDDCLGKLGVLGFYGGGIWDE